MSEAAHEQDFYRWAQDQAALLRAGRAVEADLALIAEELEAMGGSIQGELENRLKVLLLHLLKWEFQPTRRGGSWRATIRVQRRDLRRHLEKNPSLKSKLAEALNHAYGTAVILASGETGLPEESFPAQCPWSFERLMDEAFWPGRPS